MLNWASSGSAEEFLGLETQVRGAEVFAALWRLVTRESTLPGSKALVETWIMSHISTQTNKINRAGNSDE